MQSPLRGSFPSFNQSLNRSKIVNHANHSTDLCQTMHFFRDSKKFCDICVIASDDVKFYANKIVLAAFSDFFMKTFEETGTTNESGEIKIHEVNGETLNRILEFVYTGTIELERETIVDVLKAAKFLKIERLIIECYNFMSDELDVGNCLEIALFADQRSLGELYEKAAQFARRHLENVSNAEEFLKLNENQLSRIISRDDIWLSSEEEVFFGLIKWIEHDKTNREECASNLFCKVRYWLLSSDFVKKHRKKMPKQIACFEMICTWLEWHLLPVNCSSMSTELPKSKKPAELVVIDGNKKQTYNPGSDTWTSEEFTLQPFEEIVVLHNKLIISNFNEPLKFFDLQTKTLGLFPKFHTPRSDFGLAVLKGELYVVGGRTPTDENGWKRVIAKFNLSSGKWQIVASMNTAFIKPRTAVVGGLLYVTGESCCTMDCFNSDTSEWTSKKFLASNFSAFSFIGCNEELYVIAGLDLYTYRNAYRFNGITGEWEEIPPMIQVLAKTKCTSWNNRLFICGGYDESNSLLNSVQEYDSETKTWRKLAALEALKFDKFAILNI